MATKQASCFRPRPSWRRGVRLSRLRPSEPPVPRSAASSTACCAACRAPPPKSRACARTALRVAMAPQRTAAAPATSPTGTAVANSAGCGAVQRHRERNWPCAAPGSPACAASAGLHLAPRAACADAPASTNRAARPRALPAQPGPRPRLHRAGAQSGKAAFRLRCSSSASMRWSRSDRALWWRAPRWRCSCQALCSGGCAAAALRRPLPRMQLRATRTCSCRARPQPASSPRSASPHKPSGAC